MYRYETHMHTSGVSACSTADVREILELYKKIGYDGVFITNHFLDGNIRLDVIPSYKEGLEFYFSDYLKGVEIGKEIGLKVFLGIEISHLGTDFLIYGLDKEWYFEHPEIENMEKTQQLKFLMDSGALVIQAHPYREASYIDHIRLFPRSVHGVEIYNAKGTELESKMAIHYAESYGLLKFAGSDKHDVAEQTLLAGEESVTPINSEIEFIKQVLDGKMSPFVTDYADIIKDI